MSGMPLRGDRIHRYVNAFCPHCHDERPDRPLAEVRRRGWAQSIGQREAGVASVSAPVLDAGGMLLGALSLSGPIERLGRNPGQRFAPVLVTGARRLAAALG